MDTERLAHELMRQHRVSPPYLFRFDKATLRFGHHHGGTRIISLSRALTLVNDEAEVRDTILHEIAHAIVFLRHGPRKRGGPNNQSHGAVWRQVAAEIGARPHAGYSNSHAAAVRPRWIVACPSCHLSFNYQVRRRGRNRLACKACCNKFNNGKYDERFIFIWERNLPDFV